MRICRPSVKYFGVALIAFMRKRKQTKIVTLFLIPKIIQVLFMTDAAQIHFFEEGKLVRVIFAYERDFKDAP